MICNSCGGQVNDNESVCPYCGQPLTPQAPPQGQPYRQPVYQQPPYQQPPYQQPVYQPAPAVESHMGEAIFVTLFCCMPLGIVAIIFASQVSSAVNCGDIQGAQRSSKIAHTLAMTSLGIGLVFILFIVAQAL